MMPVELSSALSLIIPSSTPEGLSRGGTGSHRDLKSFCQGGFMLPSTFVSGAGIVFVPLSAVKVRSCAFPSCMKPRAKEGGLSSSDGAAVN